jgi:hypothetical protein
VGALTAVEIAAVIRVLMNFSVGLREAWGIIQIIWVVTILEEVAETALAIL